jgi:hypothetical protein
VFPLFDTTTTEEGISIHLSNCVQVWGFAMGLIDQKAGWEHMGQGIKLWLVCSLIANLDSLSNAALCPYHVAVRKPIDPHLLTSTLTFASSLQSMSPSLFLLVFLPILLFGSGSSLDWHTFFRNMTQILTLAFPGVGIHMVLVAVIYKYVFPYNWSWNEAFLYGAIISATDPVAVVRLPRLVFHMYVHTLIEINQLIKLGFFCFRNVHPTYLLRRMPPFHTGADLQACLLVNYE